MSPTNEVIMSRATRSSLESISGSPPPRTVCMVVACRMWHTVAMLMSKPHGERMGVRVGGDFSSEVEITTGLGIHSLGLVGLDTSTPGCILPWVAECWPRNQNPKLHDFLG